jgi:predicted RNase H-like HicB family nuclease/predicted RNA binding protein YcfA (HicA-like mRNA interferase family)
MAQPRAAVQPTPTFDTPWRLLDLFGHVVKFYTTSAQAQMPRPSRPLTAREVAKLLRDDGWFVKRKGPGDHVQHAHPTKAGKVTLDMGGDRIPVGTLRSLRWQAGWDWQGGEVPIAYALIHREGGVSGVSFPDFPGVVATGRTAEEAIRKGSEVLTFHVAGMDEDGDPVPMLRDLDALQRDPDFREDQAGAVLALVPFDLPTRSVRINISIDAGLLGAVDREAKAAGKSRSAFLAEAARAKLRG